MPDGEHVVDNLEALVLGGVVDGGNVRDLGVFGSSVVFEESEGGNDARGRNVDGQFILPYREPAFALDLDRNLDQVKHILLDVFGQAGHEVLAIFVQRLALFFELVCRVYDCSREFGGGIAGSKLSRMSAS